MGGVTLHLTNKDEWVLQPPLAKDSGGGCEGVYDAQPLKQKQNDSSLHKALAANNRRATGGRPQANTTPHAKQCARTHDRAARGCLLFALFVNMHGRHQQCDAIRWFSFRAAQGRLPSAEDGGRG